MKQAVTQWLAVCTIGRMMTSLLFDWDKENVRHIGLMASLRQRRSTSSGTLR